MRPQTIQYKNDSVILLDQRALPHTVAYITLTTVEEVATAIKDMVVRGAPAIGITATYGMALAAKASTDRQSAHDLLLASRPTAVNLRWALARIESIEWNYEAVLKEAAAIHQEDKELCQAIADSSDSLIPQHAKILTICNTGSLATGGIGTAYGIILNAHRKGKLQIAFSLETRPRLQGLTLTAWEMLQDEIPFKSIPDGAAAALLAKGDIDLVVAGADRIAANGDTANKIGTHGLAILARHFNVPFYIAAPSSTIDSDSPDGTNIEIEERDPTEITHIAGHQVAPEGIEVWNPAFDVTPGELITAIITENGITKPPYSF